MQVGSRELSPGDALRRFMQVTLWKLEKVQPFELSITCIDVCSCISGTWLARAKLHLVKRGFNLSEPLWT
jgi:hypothetical protein